MSVGEYLGNTKEVGGEGIVPEFMNGLLPWALSSHQKKLHPARPLILFCYSKQHDFHDWKLRWRPPWISSFCLGMKRNHWELSFPAFWHHGNQSWMRICCVCSHAAKLGNYGLEGKGRTGSRCFSTLASCLFASTLDWKIEMYIEWPAAAPPQKLALASEYLHDAAINHWRRRVNLARWKLERGWGNYRRYYHQLLH